MKIYCTRMLYPAIYSNNMFDASGIFSKNKTVNNILHINQAALIKSCSGNMKKNGGWFSVMVSLEMRWVIKFQKPNMLFLARK